MPDSQTDLSHLINQLGDSTIRESVPGRLHREGAAAINALLENLQHTDENVRSGVIWAINRMRQTTLQPLLADAIQPLTVMLQQEPVGRVRLQAIQSIQRLATPDDYDSITPVIENMLYDSEDTVRAEAVLLLAQMRHTNIRPILATMLETEPDTHVRGRLAYALAYLQPDLTLLREAGTSGINALLQALEDPERSVRMRAIWALGQLRTRTATRALTQILNGPTTPQEKHLAAEALAQIGDNAALEPLVMALQFAPEESVRCAAADALAIMGDKRALDVLVQSMRTAPQPRVRASATRALEKFADRSTADDLIAALDDNSSEVRLRAVLALGRINLKRTIPALQALLKVEEHTHIRTATATILARLEG